MGCPEENGERTNKQIMEESLRRRFPLKWVVLEVVVIQAIFLVFFGLTVGKDLAQKKQETGQEARQESGDDNLSGISTEVMMDRPPLMIPPMEEVEEVRHDTELVEYIVNPGDTLWDIAEAHTGDGWDYRILAEQSGIEDADLIYPGQAVLVPVQREKVVSVKNDWFRQKGIPITPQGDFSVRVMLSDMGTGEEKGWYTVPASVEITESKGLADDGYKRVKTVFRMDVTEVPVLRQGAVHFYTEVADRYTGVSFFQSGEDLVKNRGISSIYRMDWLYIINEEEGYKSDSILVYDMESETGREIRLIMTADVPDAYDGLIFSLGDYVDVAADESSYEPDKLYTIDQFPIEGTNQYYFSERNE